MRGDTGGVVREREDEGGLMKDEGKTLMREEGGDGQVKAQVRDIDVEERRREIEGRDQKNDENLDEKRKEEIKLKKMFK